jgi:aldehyde dehydrogenase (NAD+)
MPRLPVTKTPKCYVGGAFIRSESGRTYPLADASGSFVAHIPQCTRKDLRNAVEAAAQAGPGWARRSAYNRGQIIYRLAEMIEARAEEMASALSISGLPAADARREVAATVDRLVHYAGWADKYEQLLGNVNPVASAHFNFTVTEPTGIIGVLAPEEPALLGLVSLFAPAIVSGNVVVALASSTRPSPAIALGEMLATGFRKEILPTMATHAHLRAISGVTDAAERREIRLGAAESVKRARLLKAEEPRDWFADTAQGLHEIRELVEHKTTWHPIGA